jgi:hypothetical protein
MRYECPHCTMGGGGEDLVGYICHGCSKTIMLPYGALQNNEYYMEAYLLNEFICKETNLRFAARYWGKRRAKNLNIRIRFVLKKQEKRNERSQQISHSR